MNNEKDVYKESSERENCSCHRKKERSDNEKKALINRLTRIEGQIRGIRGMIEDGVFCPDILIQAIAVSSALSSFSKELLASHIKSCVIEDIKSGKEEAAEELASLVFRFMK